MGMYSPQLPTSIDRLSPGYLRSGPAAGFHYRSNHPAFKFGGFVTVMAGTTYEKPLHCAFLRASSAVAN